METRQGLLPGLALLLVGLLNAAAPDTPRELTPEEQKEVNQFQAQLVRHRSAGEFEAVVKVARQIADYRTERQGASHWKAIDARLSVEQWQRLTRVPQTDRAEVARSLAVAIEGRQLQRRRRFREAEAKLREALDIDRKVLGEEHPETATSYNNVAGCLTDQGKESEALPLFRKALAIRLKVLGEQHPDTANSYNNVAGCLNSEGNHTAALPLLQKALAIQRKVLGEQHPATAHSYSNVAGCLLGEQKYADALTLYRKALDVQRGVLGEQHPDTAQSYDNVATCLDAQARYAEALPLFRKALDFRLKVLGEEHPDTAGSYSNLAGCLDHQGKHAEALPLYQKALAITLAAFGEDHPETARCYFKVASCLGDQGKYAEAMPLNQKALAIFLKVLGELHDHTATSYNGVGFCLDRQGKHAEALVLYRKALEIKLKVLGELHVRTALGYGNLGLCLNAQGKYAEALPFARKALEIHEKVLGEEHPETIQSCNNLAASLLSQGKSAEALPLFRKALDLNCKVLGEEHPHVARTCNNVASCFRDLGKHADALPLYRKALDISRKALGEYHPLTAIGCSNVAACLDDMDRRDEALPLYTKAIEVKRKVQGEQHPSTAISQDNLASCLYLQGQHAEAARQWEKALLGHEFGRLQASTTGFDRSLFRNRQRSPRAALAACLVRLDRPVQAWEHAEADLARGLLDDLAPSTAKAELDRLARVDDLGLALLPLLASGMLTAEQARQRDGLVKERDDLLAELARDATKRTHDRVLALGDVQKRIPGDAALVFWLDVLDQHLGCVLRREGPPAWVKLPGSGKGAWNDDDVSLAVRTFTALADGRSDATARQKLLAALHRQRIAPLESHLEGVKRLLVVPAGTMAKLPIEALTDHYTVSYVPSASVFARRMAQHRRLEASSLLVLADPIFTRTAPELPPAPPHGLLVKAVTAGGLATRIGLRPGDVILEYGEKKLTSPDELGAAQGDDRVAVKLWRDGKTLTGRVPAGKLGVVVDRRPVAEALAEWRRPPAGLGLQRGSWEPLPGTRLEARTLAGLVPETTLLVGSDASEQELDRLASADRLKAFRILHLATHGEANPALPAETALVLSHDRLPGPDEEARMVLAGKKPPSGRLTVGRVLAKDWQLDADLVVLSACESGLGTVTRGEGMLGFTQALLQKGARSVVLSRWKVDDAATALLMERFYQNLLGKRDGLKEAMKRAEALAEAKSWLHTLSRVDAERRLAALVDGVPRGERGSIKAALPTRKPDEPKDDRPFAHPYYWAAFVLIGDPF